MPQVGWRRFAVQLYYAMTQRHSLQHGHVRSGHQLRPVLDPTTLELDHLPHEDGPPTGPRQGRGRVRMLAGEAVTSGRRIEAWGELRATVVFFAIGLRWYLGAAPAELHALYRTLYTDAYR